MDHDCILAWDRYLKEHIQIDFVFVSLENECLGRELMASNQKEIRTENVFVKQCGLIICLCSSS